MPQFVLAALSALAAASAVSAGPTFDWNNLPYQSEPQAGQIGYNNCTGPNSQSSKCQTAVVNSIDDFCLWGPPEPNSEIGATEQIEVAYCTKDGRGTRSMPKDVFTSVHFVQTPDYIQITGFGDFTKINIKAGDAGGELDPHGPDGYGNPHGGLVFTNAFTDGMIQIPEWTNFMSASEYCIRVCKPGPNAWLWCNHVFDIMGCHWNMPANYDPGFDTCKADSGTPMGLYSANGNAWGSTFAQGQQYTPNPHPAPSSSQCTTATDLRIGAAAPVLTGATNSSSTPKTTSSASATAATSGTTTRATQGASVIGAAGAAATTGAAAAPAAKTTSSGEMLKSSLFGVAGVFAAAVFLL